MIPAYDVSHTPSPTHTPTGTAEATGTHTATAAWTATHGSIATELLVAPSTTSAAADASPTADVDSGLPDFDPNDDGTIDAGEMALGVAAMTKWFTGAVRTFSEGGDVPAMVEKVVHLFGLDPAALKSEVAAAATPLIDLSWLSETDLEGGAQATTGAEQLVSHDGVGILTTGEHLAQTMSRLAVQVELAGRSLHDPDSAVRSAAWLLDGLTDQLGLESKWRDGINPQAADEIGLKGDMCLAVLIGEGSERSELKIPVLVEAEVEPGKESLDGRGVLHVSNKTPLEVIARIVDNSEVSDLQEHLRANGQVAEITRITSGHSVALQVYVADDRKPISGGQVVWCGKPEQGGVQPIPSPSATPTATETPRPQGGPGPGPGPEPSPTPVVPSATPTPRPTDALPPTNTPVGPTEAPPPTAPATSTSEVSPTNTPVVPTATEVPSRTPLPTVTDPVETETPAPPETPKATLTQLPTPENSPTPSAPLFR